VKDAEIDLELLQRLLHRGEVVDIGIGQVVSLREGGRAVAVDDHLLREPEQLFVAGPHGGRVENMVVVPAVVEPHQLELEQLRHLVRLRVEHLDHFV
jgi:hypothetical protein